MWETRQSDETHEQVERRRPRLGLALGAGGVRGAAHIGVLRILEAEGIQVDLIAGSSIGALIGAAYSAGMALDEMEQMFRRIKFRDLFQLTWPREAFFDNQPVAGAFDHYVGRFDFADLRLPVAAVATDARSGELVVIDQGNVSDAIRAAIAVPGLVTPVPWQGRELIDGGLVCKVPVNLARSMGADIVLAVDLRCIRQGYVPGRTPLSTLFRCLDIMGDRIAQIEVASADIVLRPLPKVNGFYFRHAPAWAAEGEAALKQVLPTLKGLLSGAGPVRLVH